MQYNCKVLPLTKLIAGPKGFIKPLCNTCLSKDCENPIENKLVSVTGITENMRIWSSKSTTGIVVSCDGYNP